jgi:tetratricopeptide (TPR) repeat protein
MKYFAITILILILNILTMSQTKHNSLDLPDFDLLWNFDNPGETEQKFREILPQAESSGDTSYLIQLLTQIARTEGLQMKFDDAHKTLDRAKELEPEKYAAAYIRYLLERGRAYNSSKVKDKAKELFLEAYNYGKNNTSAKGNLDFYTIDAAHMMGIVEQGDESLKWNEIAIKLAEESTDERSKKWLGSLCNNTGWTYFDMGKYDKAMELFEKNVVWHTERNSEMPLIIAKWCVARTFRALNQVNEALNMQLDLIDELKEKGLEQDGYVFEEIGECLYMKGKTEDAKPYFKQAYEILSKDIWLQENEKERLARLKQLSE